MFVTTGQENLETHENLSIQRLDELAIRAMCEIDFGVLFSSEQLSFIGKNVFGYRINGVNVLLCVQDHENFGQNEKPNSLYSSLMIAENTCGIGLEYYHKEMDANGYGKGGELRSYWYERLVRNSPKHRGKFRWSEQVEAIVQSAGKPIMVFDNANNWQFEAHQKGQRLAAALLSGTGVILSIINSTLEMIPLSLIPLASTLPFQMWGLKEAWRENGGKVDQKKLPWVIEHWGYDLEDSRRVQVASEIIKMTKEMKREEGDHPNPKLVVFYPRCHVEGIAYFLEHEKLRRIKHHIYRYTTPGLEKSTRVYNLNGD